MTKKSQIYAQYLQEITKQYIFSIENFTLQAKEIYK